tara:strand:- start:25884 stop:26186 length:303 start_codon:yes stop_codon:yes gene_type:complete
MARKSVIEREIKREKLVAKYAETRSKLKEIIRTSIDEKEKWDAVQKLQQLPRNSLPCRKRSRCNITGRPRGVLEKFGLCNKKLREEFGKGSIPGLETSSW